MHLTSPETERSEVIVRTEPRAATTGLKLVHDAHHLHRTFMTLPHVNFQENLSIKI